MRPDASHGSNDNVHGNGGRSRDDGLIIHWPLLWRDLRRDWTFKGGRVMQLGDAAHATVLTSVAGGTLGLGDAVTLASENPKVLAQQNLRDLLAKALPRPNN